MWLERNPHPKHSFVVARAHWQPEREVLLDECKEREREWRGKKILRWEHSRHIVEVELWPSAPLRRRVVWSSNAKRESSENIDLLLWSMGSHVFVEVLISDERRDLTRVVRVSWLVDWVRRAKDLAWSWMMLEVMMIGRSVMQSTRYSRSWAWRFNCRCKSVKRVRFTGEEIYPRQGWRLVLTEQERKDDYQHWWLLSSQRWDGDTG